MDDFIYNRETRVMATHVKRHPHPPRPPEAARHPPLTAACKMKASWSVPAARPGVLPVTTENC